VLYGAQLGTDWNFENQSQLELGWLYDYSTSRSAAALVGNRRLDGADYMQKGTACSTIEGTAIRVRAVSDYDILNLTARYDSSLRADACDLSRLRAQYRF